MSQRTTRRKTKPAVLDIFCGAGGMSLGFKWAGCEILGGIDENKYAIDTHHKNFPECKFKISAQDIREIQCLEDLGLEPHDVDILIGGPPCQVFSKVGLGKMRQLGRNIEADHRNFLYKQYVRFVAYYKPLCFVMENVDNLASKKKKDVMAQILEDLNNGDGAEDYPGYRVEHKVLDASEYGVPQKRKRLFIIGVRADLGLEPVFPANQTSALVSVREAIEDLPELEPFKITLGVKNSIPKKNDFEHFYKHKPTCDYQRKMRQRKKEGEGVMNHLCRAHNDKDLQIFNLLEQGGKYKDLPEEMRRYRVDIFNDKYKRLIWEQPSWTLTAHMRKDGLAYIHPLQDRSISVREAARIQSFPDDFVFYLPMTRMFELVGNSVPPLLAEAVAKPLVNIVTNYYKTLENS